MKLLRVLVVAATAAGSIGVGALSMPASASIDSGYCGDGYYNEYSDGWGGYWTDTVTLVDSWTVSGNHHVFRFHKYREDIYHSRNNSTATSYQTNVC